MVVNVRHRRDRFPGMSDGVSLFTVVENDHGLAVAGEIDANTATELAARLDPLPGSGDLHLDMSAVEFMDSSGLRVLIDAHQRAEQEGRRLVIVRQSTPVHRVIQITGLDDHLHVSSS